LKLLLDENAQSIELAQVLEEKGHDVLTAAQAHLIQTPDRVILKFAHESERVVLTFNCDDFRCLHVSEQAHCGILAVYRTNNVKKDMVSTEIAGALAKLEAAGVPITGEFIALNHWKP
jgi:predicted nuclease of predicted toxin-antitoxin system